MLIINTDTNEVPVRQNVLPTDSELEKMYIGVMIVPSQAEGVEPSRGFLTRENYRRGRYRVMSVDGLTVANGWPCYVFDADSVTDVIEQCIRDRTDVPGRSRVFVFADKLEFLKWLSE